MKNNVYPCKPQFYYIKVGFKGGQIYIDMFSWWFAWDLIKGKRGILVLDSNVSKPFGSCFIGRSTAFKTFQDAQKLKMTFVNEQEQENGDLKPCFYDVFSSYGKRMFVYYNDTDKEHKKHTFGHVRPAKIQIRLRESSLGRILDSQGCKVSSCGQRGLRPDCTGWFEPSLAFMSEGTLSDVAVRLVSEFPAICLAELAYL